MQVNDKLSLFPTSFFLFVPVSSLPYVIIICARLLMSRDAL